MRRVWSIPSAVSSARRKNRNSFYGVSFDHCHAVAIHAELERRAEEMLRGVGLVMALVEDSITISLAHMNGPRALISIATSAVRPAPLLSVGEATA